MPPTAAQTVRSAARVSLSSQKTTVFTPLASLFFIIFFKFNSAVDSIAQFTE